MPVKLTRNISCVEHDGVELLVGAGKDEFADIDEDEEILARPLDGEDEVEQIRTLARIHDAPNSSLTGDSREASLDPEVEPQPQTSKENDQDENEG